MKTILGIGIAIAIYFGIYLLFRMVSFLVTVLRNKHQHPTATAPRSSPFSSSGLATAQKPTWSQVSTTTTKTGIAFCPIDSRGVQRAAAIDLAGINDAFTGEPLEKAKGSVYQCMKCKVYYLPGSMEVLRGENQGRCVSCLGSDIRLVTKEMVAAQPGQSYTPGVVTLADYRAHEGHVITFEGFVPRINRSRDGQSYAVMFENTSWTKGLKMVVFRGNVADVGGSEFLYSLKGKIVRVRGLLKKHPIFGYEIIISSRSMILGVR
jgi:hypothetical protein